MLQSSKRFFTIHSSLTNRESKQGMKVKFKQVGNGYMFRSHLGLKAELKPGNKKWDLFINSEFKESRKLLRDLKERAVEIINTPSV